MLCTLAIIVGIFHLRYPVALARLSTARLNLTFRCGFSYDKFYLKLLREPLSVVLFEIKLQREREREKERERERAERADLNREASLHLTDKNSSGDEIANVNFLRRYGTYVLKNTKKENLLRLTN